MLRCFGTPLGACGSSSRAFRSCCPEQREAACIRVSIPLVWTGVGWVLSQSLVGWCSSPLFWRWRGGVLGLFNHLVASLLRIRGSLLVLASGGSICRP